MKRITLVFLSLLLALFAILLNSCDRYDVSEDKINIATTLFINYDIIFKYSINLNLKLRI